MKLRCGFCGWLCWVEYIPVYTILEYMSGGSRYMDNKQMFQTPIVTQHGSHMVMTNADRAGVSKVLVNFDTRFSPNFTTDDSANYNFVLPIRLTNVKSMSVVNVEVPMTYYNIDSRRGNNTFRLSNIDNEATLPIIIPDGQYTLDQLVTTMNGLLPADVSFSINTDGQSVFTTGGTSEYYYLEFYTDSAVDNNKNDPKFRLGWMLGFRYVAYPILKFSNLVSECPCNLNGSRYLYLVVDDFQNGKENTFNSLVSSSMLKKNILARVTPSYVKYPYGSVLPANLANGWLRSDCRKYNHGKVDIQRLQVQLVNEIGQIMHLNGGHIMFCLEFEVQDSS